MKYVYGVITIELPEYYGGLISDISFYENLEEAFSKKNALESENTNEDIFYEVIVSEQSV